MYQSSDPDAPTVGDIKEAKILEEMGSADYLKKLKDDPNNPWVDALARIAYLRNIRKQGNQTIQESKAEIIKI